MKPDLAKALLIIALSSRPYVEAAKHAGLRVVAIDAFADQQTHNAAERIFTVAYDEHGFNAEMMMSVIDGLNVNDYWGVIYGGGFETQPVLLQYIADRIPLIGNNPVNVAAVKTPNIFFAALAKLAIPHPPTKGWHPTGRIANSSQKSYIRKLAGGSGGTHIQYLTESQPADNYYDQEYLEGDSVSLLFLAQEGEVEVLGFNEQWLAPSASTPFRYGGAVSNVQLESSIQAQLEQAAQKLTLEFKLNGINSLDAIVQKELVYILEINPRLSATFDLYPEKATNILRHIQASQPKDIGESTLTSVTLTSVTLTSVTFTSVDLTSISKLHHAHAIVYAPEALAISAVFDWPTWSTDIPNDLCIAAQQPVCTVFATGESRESAKQLAQSRVKMLLESITENNQVKLN